MRIAYVAPYHGPTLLRRRPIVRNRSMSGSLKMELIAKLLFARAHDVEVISQGEVVDSAQTFYPAFSEPERFHPGIPIHYASVLPVRRLNGAWSNRTTLRLFKARHKASAYDLMIIYNLKGPQVACADYAVRRLGLPVILEYEDDRFVSVGGDKVNGFVSRYQNRSCARLLEAVSGCIAVSPHLLSQTSDDVPKVLLRGVVGDDIVTGSHESRGAKKNRILFSGTHIASNGVAQLIEGWRQAGLSDWELHITGYGQLSDTLREMSQGVAGIVFHGLVDRSDLVRLMCSAKVCINPHQVSHTPGNVFAFKIVEYLAAGAHVITTPMGTLEPEIEAGITYMADNSPGTIAATMRQVIAGHDYERTAEEAAHRAYGSAAVSRSLDTLIARATTRS